MPLYLPQHLFTHIINSFQYIFVFQSQASSSACLSAKMSNFNRNVQKPLNYANQKSVSQKHAPELSKEKLARFSSVFLLLDSFLKGSQKQRVRQTFTKVKKFTQTKKKYSELMAKKLNFLFRQKSRSYTKTFFSQLVTIRIQSFKEQVASHRNLKQNLKKKSAGALLPMLHKIYQRKLKETFGHLNSKGQLMIKLKAFKTVHLNKKVNDLLLSRMQFSFGQMSGHKLTHYLRVKNFVRLESFFKNKQKKNISSAFTVLRLNQYKSKMREVEGSTESPIDNQTANKVTPQQKRQLESKKLSLEKELRALEEASAQKLKSLRQEVSQLQKQRESLKFNNDLLEQNNQELEREYNSKQQQTRKKLSKDEIWENVYNNLIYFLAANRGKSVSKSQFLECLEMPLVSIGYGVDLNDIKDENAVLEELLTEYRKSFPKPSEESLKSEQESLLLPYDLLKSQNRYYYMVLEVLSEWGVAGTDELKELNSNLELLQKKVVE